jgi:phosphoglycerate kinase
VLGGAKVSDKLEVIENLLGAVDALLIGGAMAYTFLKARGRAGRQVARRGGQARRGARYRERAAERAGSLELPVDHVVAREARGRRAGTRRSDVGDAAIGDRMGLDIGPKTIAAYASASRGAKTVVWNGPMGVFEIDAFAPAPSRSPGGGRGDGTTIIGGGDSIAAVAKAGVADRITHISTGGGASLEFLGGRCRGWLPGVAVLVTPWRRGPLQVG